MHMRETIYPFSFQQNAHFAGLRGINKLNKVRINFGTQKSTIKILNTTKYNIYYPESQKYPDNIQNKNLSKIPSLLAFTSFIVSDFLFG